ncbi:hypothetical protein CK203_097960 [Vitis vinifera]|uniref:Uncharacterized protein n=1 Tax=Vitis vinifera TaxID=29760 RepID=A0A438CXZ0_VITVI|nr:hypothetical protein CK203_097960 [Vitis vinifera]
MKKPSFRAPQPFAKVVQSMQGEKQGERKNRVKKTEDSSCSLLLYFWSTSRSPFSTCCIPFQRSRSQESNASNRVQFGAEMRKLQPLEDDCSKLKEGFSKVLRNQPFVARISQPFCTVLWIPPEVARHIPREGSLEPQGSIQGRVNYLPIYIPLHPLQPNFEDFSSKDEKLSFLSLGVKKAGQVISVHGDALVYPLRAFGRWFEGKSKVKDHLEWQVLGERYEPLQGASEHQLDTNQLRHQLGTNQMATVAGGSNFESNGAIATARDESNGAAAGGWCHFTVISPFRVLVIFITSLIAEEAMNFISYVAEFSREWGEPNDRDKRRMTSQPKAKGEMYILNDGMNMKTEIAAMERRLEELEMTNMQPVQAISQTSLQAMLCAICLSYEHLVDECPIIPAEREMFGDCNTYNSNWRDHPNFSWKPQPPQYQQPAQSPQQASNLEQAMVNLCKVMEDFVGNQEAINAQINQRIDRVESTLNKRMDEMQNDMAQKLDILQDSISRLANLKTMQEKENSPLNLIKIPRASM